jgi:hypothetical protein
VYLLLRQSPPQYSPSLKTKKVVRVRSDDVRRALCLTLQTLSFARLNRLPFFPTSHGARFRHVFSLQFRFFRNFAWIAQSLLVLGRTQSRIYWVPRALTPSVQRSGSETDHPPPFSADVIRIVQLYRHSPHTSSWLGAKLIKHSDNFMFTLPYPNSPFLNTWHPPQFVR